MQSEKYLLYLKAYWLLASHEYFCNIYQQLVEKAHLFITYLLLLHKEKKLYLHLQALEKLFIAFVFQFLLLCHCSFVCSVGLARGLL